MADRPSSKHTGRTEIEMTDQRWNTKRQEATGETRRVRVGLVYNYTGSRVKDAHVYLVDMVTNEILDYGVTDRNGAYWKKGDPERDSVNKRWHRTHFTKKDAIATAKRLAMATGCPFHPTNDLVPDVEIREGPLTFCMLCGETVRIYSFEPFICKRCRTVYKVGLQHEADDDWALIHTEDLVQYPGIAELTQHGFLASEMLPEEIEAFRGDTSNEYKLAVAILAVAGAMVQRKPHDAPGVPDKMVIKGSDKGYPKKPPLPFRGTETQVKAMNRLIKMIRAMIHSANLYGLREGSNLIAKTLSGELPPDAFIQKRNESRHG
jgi:hypothetical protein